MSTALVTQKVSCINVNYTSKPTILVVTVGSVAHGGEQEEELFDNHEFQESDSQDSVEGK